MRNKAFKNIPEITSKSCLITSLLKGEVAKKHLSCLKVALIPAVTPQTSLLKERLTPPTLDCSNGGVLKSAWWHHVPLIRSTKYSWFGVRSKYCTIVFRVGMSGALTSAACFKLLMLASATQEEPAQVSYDHHRTPNSLLTWRRYKELSFLVHHLMSSKHLTCNTMPNTHFNSNGVAGICFTSWNIKATRNQHLLRWTKGE